MNYSDVEKELLAVSNSLKNVLDPSYMRTLDIAKQNIKAQKESKSRAQRRNKNNSDPWKLVIDPSSPLKFRECTIRGQCLQVDLFCRLSQPETEEEYINDSLTIRIWSNDSNLCFREEFDSENIRSEFEAHGKRVLSRFHFDEANENQEGPGFHFQFGGIPQNNEICWFPKNLNIPRFIHHPMNLILACEYIIANFFPDKWREISREGSWLAAIRKAQESFLKPYYDGIQSGWTATENSLLKHLWNIP